ncbi:3'-5' exonuclease [Desulfurispirillum indicum]|uniref:Exonuclease RNase T and DNA polymerase III n=1 Tax=Desulfurispirillum indicum (strain ATCC BAA-1389 / DSM 22839 / S5) TaxID=653733 RepID=E6W1F9_DESIS|nr:3'-5' exonuclease [Desulfurispirillum indicum]ADU65415.1 Exonuclease RNase T and DNA polymerase III [Desulfurispirillum indicum S5]UCZ57333.1 3'-5' exonuclease [Desulfurispirillum indicum]
MFYLPSPRKEEPQLNQVETTAPDWPTRLRALAAKARDQRLQAFYGAGVVDGDTPISQVPLLALDFETTGFDPKRHGIVSIGLVPMSLQRIRCAEARHWIVKPRVQLESQSIVVHGITHSDVATAPDLARILDELLEAMAGHVMVVHHRGIERSFLDAALKARIGEGIQFPVIDTMELEARLHRQKPPGLLARLLGRKPVSIRLAASRARCNLPHYRPHHALTDALATAELLQAQIAHHFSPETPIQELWK